MSQVLGLMSGGRGLCFLLGRGIIFEHRFWIIFEHRCPGSFSNTEWVIFEHMGGLSCGTRGVGGGGGVGQLRSPLTACPCNCALEEGGNQEAPSPKLPWLFELRCPRRLAPVGPRKAVSTV